MPIPVNDDMVDQIAGDDLWEQANISYSINLREAGHQTDAAEDKFGSPPAFVSVTLADRWAIQEAVELWDDLIDNTITGNNTDSAVISVNQVSNMPSYVGGIIAELSLEFGMPQSFKQSSEYFYQVVAHKPSTQSQLAGGAARSVEEA